MYITVADITKQYRVIKVNPFLPRRNQHSPRVQALHQVQPCALLTIASRNMIIGAQCAANCRAALQYYCCLKQCTDHSNVLKLFPVISEYFETDPCFLTKIWICCVHLWSAILQPYCYHDSIRNLVKNSLLFPI